jgi:pimeloyl-ACP methyl ester carboxylesterase
VLQYAPMPLTFDPHDSSFNRANALYLAHAADVAYHRSPAAAARERLGLDTVAFRNKITRTRGFLGICDTHAVLAFRGTDPVTLPNWVTDAVVRLVACREYDGRVHHGFSSVLRHTWPKVQDVLDAVADKPLFLTGHSMGGALAVLTACRLAALGRSAVATYTFGSPRIGDRTFCAGYALPTYRIVNRLDLVPELPLAASVTRLLPLPQGPLRRAVTAKILAQLQRLAERVPCYEHIKTFVYIDHDGTVTPDADVEPWHANAVARAIATRGKSFLEGVTDHLIANYIRGLKGQLSPRQSRVRRLTADKGKAGKRKVGDEGLEPPTSRV